MADQRRQPRQPSVESGKRLFKTLQADARTGRSRSLSARGAASLAMYLASVGDVQQCHTPKKAR